MLASIWLKSMHSSRTTGFCCSRGLLQSRHVFCRSRGLPQSRTVAVAVMTSIFDKLLYEVAETIGPHKGNPEISRHHFDHRASVWRGPLSEWWPPASAWRGPLSEENVCNAAAHKTMYVGLTTKSKTGAKKYIFQEEYNLPGGRHLWIYRHCSGKSNLIIRPVPPSPEIHVVMKGFPPDRQGFRCKGMQITAVAEDDRTIISELITENCHAAKFKQAVKRKCIELGQCTESTDLTIYHDNVIMSSRMMLEADFRPTRRRRQIDLFPIIAAGDIERP